MRPRSSQVGVFTGRDVIIWGGRSDAAGNVAPAQGPGTPRYVQLWKRFGRGRTLPALRRLLATFSFRSIREVYADELAR